VRILQKEKDCLHDITQSRRGRHKTLMKASHRHIQLGLSNELEEVMFMTHSKQRWEFNKLWPFSEISENSRFLSNLLKRVKKRGVHMCVVGRNSLQS